MSLLIVVNLVLLVLAVTAVAISFEWGHRLEPAVAKKFADEHPEFRMAVSGSLSPCPVMVAVISLPCASFSSLSSAASALPAGTAAIFAATSSTVF